jgi:hypothetical protein
MRLGKGNRSTQRKPAAMPLCPPQIPHDLTWARTRATAEGNRRLTAWAMTRPPLLASTNYFPKYGTREDEVSYTCIITSV